MIAHDKTPLVGAGGLLASFSLEQVNLFLGALVSLATLGYVVTKWVVLLRAKQPAKDKKQLELDL